MKINEQVDKILEENKSKRTLRSAFLALIAEDRRDWIYYLLQLEKAQGPKWAEKIRAQAAEDHTSFGHEPEDVEKE